MAYFRKITSQLEGLLDLLKKDERWLILMNADPDALASAMGLKRILARRVHSIGLAQVNEIARPDNLAMIRYLRIPARRLTPNLAAQYDRFALVDSQPHHHPDFESYDFSILIDHHPLPEKPFSAPYTEIKPEYGATSTMLTEYLYNLNLRPGKLLATALAYGIKTDTQSFDRQFTDADIKAFRYLSKFANQLILRKIAKSEFKLSWLKYFSQAFYKMRLVGKGGMFVYMGEVDSSDILVILADFFLRVHEISWTVVCGKFDDNLTAIFRGDGVRRDMGKLANHIFKDLGSAGGHRAMARAEVPIEKIGGEDPRELIWNRLQQRKCFTASKCT